MSSGVRPSRFSSRASYRPLASAPHGTRQPGAGGRGAASKSIRRRSGGSMQQFQAPHYLPADGTPSPLVSTLSRQDLEAQIALHYFGNEPGFENKPPALPLAM